MFLLIPLLIGCRVDPKEGSSATCDDTLECVDSEGLSPCEDCDTTCLVDELPTDDQRHLDGAIDYEHQPPAGGPHNRCWAEWGVHTDEVSAINFVHNQEHGGIIFLYNCPEGCETEVALLTELAETLAVQVVLGPYPQMGHRFAATAWEHRLLMNCLDIGAMEAFYRDHVDQGPESSASMPPGDCM